MNKREKKRIVMINKSISLETDPIPIIEDTTVNPINPWQEKMNNSLEGPSISTTVDEQALHGTNQEVKRRCSLGDVSIPTSSQGNKSQYQD